MAYIRVAEPEDAPAVWKVHVASIAGLCSRDYTKEQIEAWVGPRKPDDYLDPISEGRLFVAEVEGEAVGFGEFGLGSEGEIHAIYVVPGYARQGIGKALFQRLIEELTARGAKQVVLSVSLTSVPFYRAMGCTPGPMEKHCLRSGVEIPCIRMKFEISQ